MDENISRAAGANHGQEADDTMFGAIVEPLGRPLVQRTTLYGRTTTVGRRLRPPDDLAHARRGPGHCGRCSGDAARPAHGDRVSAATDPGRRRRDRQRTSSTSSPTRRTTFLAEQGMAKGSMALVDTEQRRADLRRDGTRGRDFGWERGRTPWRAWRRSVPRRVHRSGGRRPTRRGLHPRPATAGVQFDPVPAVDGLPTGRSLILVTPDAERTMNTYLGASAQLHRR